MNSFGTPAQTLCRTARMDTHFTCYLTFLTGVNVLFIFKEREEVAGTTG